MSEKIVDYSRIKHSKNLIHVKSTFSAIESTNKKARIRTDNSAEKSNFVDFVIIRQCDPIQMNYHSENIAFLFVSLSWQNISGNAVAATAHCLAKHIRLNDAK